jgi:para-nitrobenzyl esterase
MRPTTTGEHVVVEIASGAIRGFWRPLSAAFLGIPLAESPYGDLRFLAPAPVRSWAGVRDALRYGPTPQRKALAEITTIPEPSIPGHDILNLNVFTPRPRPAHGSEELLPVLV